ncbi:MAG: hypothetical protein OZ921_08270 [Sorangiineae bacterium]|nr:hypothetical protein [Polyangiaceae bacterium]MEB2322494.1 hypothetical protein [Sorangiineae bacterium]
MKRSSLTLLAAVVVACSPGKGEAPPPAASARVVPAPPNALGAQAASRTDPSVMVGGSAGAAGGGAEGDPLAPPAAPAEPSADAGVPL